MRTCPKCGCYIPDNWITCPACGKTEMATKTKVSVGGGYRVELYYKDNTTSHAMFGMYEHALKYAVMSTERHSVQFVEVWDCQTHARLHLLS